MRHSTAPPNSGIRLTRALIERRRKTGGPRPGMQLTEDLPAADMKTRPGLYRSTTTLTAGAAPPPSLGQAMAGVA